MIRRGSCEPMANCPLPCESFQILKIFEVSASAFSTVGVHRQFCAGAYEFLSTVTESVVHSVHTIRRHKVSYGIGGLWSLSLGDQCLWYCHPTVIDS